MNRINTFPLARYRFEFQVTRPIRLPDYAGSMLGAAPSATPCANSPA